MKVRLTLGQLLDHVLDNNPQLHRPLPVHSTPAQQKAHKATMVEVRAVMPRNWDTAYRIFCARYALKKSSENPSPLTVPEQWISFQKDRPDDLALLDEEARVGRIEYLLAHSEALVKFHSTENTPAWDR
jgi:hypothetical protein